jgi:histidinol-phosphate aminotransferase
LRPLEAYAGEVTSESEFQLSDLPLRDVLRGKSPYGAPQDPVPVSLNVNENTHPVPEAVIADITDQIHTALRTVNRYPDRDFTRLREALAKYLGYGLSAQQVWAANGSNEVLQQVLQAFGGPGRSLLSFTPTYSMYPLLADGTDTAWVPIQRPTDFELTPEFASQALSAHEPTVAIICGPNNPTGTPLSHDVVTAAYDAFDGILIIDEAYYEFDQDHDSAIELLAGRPRLAVSRTMSKAFAFAGVRLGYLAADPVLLDALKLVRLPYHLSALTQAAATTALAHADTMLKTVDDIRQQRQRLAQALTRLGYTVYPSGANFLLVGGFADSHSMFTKLLERGILVRDIGIPGHLRITAGTEDETSALIHALTEIHNESTR